MVNNEPPKALEVEASILGALMLEKEAAPKAMGILKPEHFYDPKNQIIFETMVNLFNSNDPIETTSVYEELKKNQKLERIGGAVYISQLSANISSAAHIEYHCRIVLEKYIARQLIKNNLEAVQKVNESLDIIETLEEQQRDLFRISNDIYKKSYQKMDVIVRRQIELLEKIKNGNHNDLYYSTQIKDLDRIILGFHRGDYIILGARPSMGKTATALQIMLNMALSGLKVGFFSLEMSELKITNRLFANISGVDSKLISSGKFSNKDAPLITRAAQNLSKLPIYIDDTPGLSEIELRSKAYRMKHELGIDILFVDYLQLMSSSIRKENREREVSFISQLLKKTAKELNIPLVVLAQLNRSLETRSDKRPILSDLRESGSIEQDADVVMFLYRAEEYGIIADNDGNSTEGILEIIIAKGRDVGTGACKVKYQKQINKITDIDFYHNLPEPAPNYHDKDEFDI